MVRNSDDTRFIITGDLGHLWIWRNAKFSMSGSSHRCTFDISSCLNAGMNWKDEKWYCVVPVADAQKTCFLVITVRHCHAAAQRNILMEFDTMGGCRPQGMEQDSGGARHATDITIC